MFALSANQAMLMKLWDHVFKVQLTTVLCMGPTDNVFDVSPPLHLVMVSVSKHMTDV